LREYFGSAKRAWEASFTELVKIGLGEKLTVKFDRFRQEFSFDECIKDLEEKKIQVVTLKDKNYPKLLREIPDAPFLLYVRGSVDMLQNEVRPRIAVVGTRKITSYGREVTRRLTEGLVDAGFTIVSGMAYGVDTVAHQTALENKGKTIAVLGCGVDIIHPVSNTALYWQIVREAGSVVSEFPPSMMADKGLFPARNRIISGLSLGVLVTEGAEDSGALITARYAAEQGREVFAIPGPITSQMSKGPTILLKQGAKLVTEVNDILEELHIRPIRQISQIGNKMKQSFTGDEQKILELLQNENLHFDEIVRKSKISPDKIGSLLTMMELKGMIKNLGGSNYSIVA
jgi:DNA processing protein